MRRRRKTRDTRVFRRTRFNRDGVTPLERLLAKVDTESSEIGCWLWTAAQSWDGYGLFSLEGVVVRAHRASVVLHGGHIPSKMVVDHLCGQRRCINPEHLEVVTQSENVKRGYEAADAGEYLISGDDDDERE